jgi:hypothetical protein
MMVYSMADDPEVEFSARQKAWLAVHAWGRIRTLEMQLEEARGGRRVRGTLLKLGDYDGEPAAIVRLSREASRALGPLLYDPVAIVAAASRPSPEAR